MALLSDPQVWISLLTLTSLEIVLGIDNIIFITILAGKLPEHQQKLARNLGLGAALLARVILLMCIGWVMSLKSEVFSIFAQSISGRDIVLILGGGFLLAKSTIEIHNTIEGDHLDDGAKSNSFWGTILQIALLDIVFSLDSVITAIGMAKHIPVMVAAVMIAIAVMMISATRISQFVHNNPTVKMLALSFLVLIGTTLIAEGLDLHIPKGYIYFAMAFSVIVEMLNLKLKKTLKQSKLSKNH